MKKLLANGFEQIVGAGVKTPSGAHDPWPTHANIANTPSVSANSTGQAALFMNFVLKDGTQFYYIAKFYDSYEDASAALQPWINDALWKWNLNYFGERFNFVLRQQLGTKWTIDEYDTWLFL